MYCAMAESSYLAYVLPHTLIIFFPEVRTLKITLLVILENRIILLLLSNTAIEELKGKKKRR